MQSTVEINAIPQQVEEPHFDLQPPAKEIFQNFAAPEAVLFRSLEVTLRYEIEGESREVKISAKIGLFKQSNIEQNKVGFRLVISNDKLPLDLCKAISEGFTEKRVDLSLVFKMLLTRSILPELEAAIRESAAPVIDKFHPGITFFTEFVGGDGRKNSQIFLQRITPNSSIELEEWIQGIIDELRDRYVSLSADSQATAMSLAEFKNIAKGQLKTDLKLTKVILNGDTLYLEVKDKGGKKTAGTKDRVTIYKQPQEVYGIFCGERFPCDRAFRILAIRNSVGKAGEFAFSPGVSSEAISALPEVGVEFVNDAFRRAKDVPPMRYYSTSARERAAQRQPPPASDPVSAPVSDLVAIIGLETPIRVPSRELPPILNEDDIVKLIAALEAIDLKAPGASELKPKWSLESSIVRFEEGLPKRFQDEVGEILTSKRGVEREIKDRIKKLDDLFKAGRPGSLTGNQWKEVLLLKHTIESALAFSFEEIPAIVSSFGHLCERKLTTHRNAMSSQSWFPQLDSCYNECFELVSKLSRAFWMDKQRSSD